MSALPAEPSLVVVGPITRDTVAAVDELPPPGGSAVTEQLWSTVGGKGANPAIAAARLGARATLLGAVGADNVGRDMLGQLRVEHVDVDAVAVLPDVRTGEIVHLVEPDGRRRFVEFAGANGVWPLRPGVVRRACRPAGSVLISTALPACTVRRAVQEAAAAQAWVCLDLAGPEATSRAVIAEAAVVRADAHEASVLTDIDVCDVASARRAADLLRQSGPQIAIVQAGDDGNVFRGPDLDLALPQVSLPTVDPTGAGDALIATWVTLTAAGHDGGHAARLASAAAGHVAARLGGRPRFRMTDELQQLVERTAA